jgi:hypothetical protein
MPIVNGESVEYGCYVDGVNGQYCAAIVVGEFVTDAPISVHARRAARLKLAEQTYPRYQMFNSRFTNCVNAEQVERERIRHSHDRELTDSVHDEIEWAYEQVEQWLNDHTDEGWWGFNDGDFGLWQVEDDD